MSFVRAVVLSGRFRKTNEGEKVMLEAGDYLLVPRGAVHSVEAVGGEPVVGIYAIRKQVSRWGYGRTSKY